MRAALRACARVYVPSHRPIPLVSLWADVRTERIVTAGHGAQGCAIYPATAQAAQLAVLDPKEPVTAAKGVVPHGPVVRNRSWIFARDARYIG